MGEFDDPKEDAMSDMQIAPPVKTRRHIKNAISLRGLNEQVKRADGINAKIAVFLTNIVGSMWCAYAFAILALIGLRPALKPGGEGLIAWIAQTFLAAGTAVGDHGGPERAERGQRRPIGTHL